MADYNLGTAKGKIEIDASGVATGVAQANASLGTLDKSAGSAGAGVAALGAGMAGMGAVALGGFGMAIKTAADFEKQLSGIRAVSGATADQMELVSDKALQLGADTSFSAGEAASAMEELVKAGLTVDDVLNGAADATVSLAAAGEIALPEAATIAANAMNQFGLAAQDMPRIADLIAGAANSSAIDVSDFGMSMSQAGATANLVGLSFDDMALAITAMGNAGIKGSDAGTSLKTFLANLQPTTEKQIELFAELGLTMEENATGANTLGNAFFDAEGQVKDMAGIAGTLATALEGQSDAQKAATLEAIFGSDAIRAAAVIAETGAEGFDTLAASMSNVTAEEVANLRLDNLAGDVDALTGSFETFMIRGGTPFLGFAREIVQRITDVVNWMGELDEETLKIIGTVTAIAGAVLLFGGGALLLGKALGPVILGLRAAAIAVKIFTGSLLTNPLFLMVAAAAAIGYALYKLYQQGGDFKEWVDGMIVKAKEFAEMVRVWFVETALPAIINFWEGIRPALEQFGQFLINEVLPRVIEFGQYLIALWQDTILPALQAAFEYFTTVIVPILVSAFETIRSVVQSVIGFIVDTLIPALAGAWTSVQTSVGPIIEWFQTHVAPTITAVVDLIIAVFQRIVDFMQIVLPPAFYIFETVIVPLVQAALGAIQTAIEFFIDVAQTAWSLFGDNIVSAIQIAFDVIRTIVETVLGVIRGIVQVLTGLITLDFDKFLEGLKTLWDTVWNAIKNIVEIVWDAIKLIVETAVDLIVGIVETGWNAAKAAVETAVNLIEDIVTATWNLIKDAVETAVNTIKDIVTNTWNAIYDAVNEAITRIRNFIERTWDSIVAWIEDLLGGLADIFGGAWDAVYDAISPIIDSIISVIEGIAAPIEWIADKVDWLIDKINSIPSISDLNPFGGGIDTDALIREAQRQGIPTNAKGGIFTRATLGIFGEAGAEAIIPLTDQARAMSLMQASGLDRMVLSSYSGGSATLTGGGGSSTTTTYGPGVQVNGDLIIEDRADWDMLMMQAELTVSGSRGF